MSDDRRTEEELDRLLAESLREFDGDTSVGRSLAPGDAALLAATQARVRGRRRRRWLLQGVTLVVAFGLGLGIGSGRAGEPDGSPPEARPAVEDGEGPEPSPADPRALEARAENLAAADRAAILKEAGDRYLAEWGDVSGALRCYRQVCELLPAADVRRIEPSDTWLLVALKSDRSD